MKKTAKKLAVASLALLSCVAIGIATGCATVKGTLGGVFGKIDGFVSDLTHVHEYDVLKWDAAAHWYECACGEKVEAEVEVHKLGEATCVAPKSCTVCGYTVGEALGHDWLDATCTEPKTCETCSETEGEALGHSYGEPTYVWNDDYTVCTATRVCVRDEAHTETENATRLTDEVLVPVAPTCENNGTAVYAFAFTNPAFEKQFKAVLLEATGHSYGEWVVTTEPTKEKAGLLTKTCENDTKHTETFTLPALNKTDYTYSVTSAAKCEEAGAAKYTYTKDGQNFEFTEVLPALGHKYGTATYAWNADNTTCTAERVCANDNTHKETATATVTSSTTPSTCTEKGKTVYTATFTETWASEQTKEVEIPALNHKYGKWVVTTEPTKEKAGLLTKTCENDTAHTETFTLPALNKTDYTYSVTSAAKCEEAGAAKYTYIKDGQTFEFTVTLSATGHDFDTSEWGYKEKDGHAHVCSVCGEPDEVIGHTSSGAATEDKAETCTVCEYMIAPELEHVHAYDTLKYNANNHWYVCRCNETKDVAAHTGGTATCTEQKTCTVCNQKYGEALGHDKIQHAAQAPTCTEIGWEAYETCSRCDYSTYEKLPAKGHNYGTVVTEPTCTERGYTTYTCEVCGDNYVDDYVNALGHKEKTLAAKAPTCTATGLTEGKECSVCGETLVAQEEVLALGHSYGTPMYTWADNTACTAERVCAKDNTHKETATATVTSSTTPATCTEDGKTVYTATFAEEWASDQTEEVVLEATGHDHQLKSNETKHWYECECGDTKDEEAHKVDEVTGPTGTCKVCETEYTLTAEEIVNAAYALAVDETLEGTYTLTGIVSEVNYKFSASAKTPSISITIVIGELTDKSIYCYYLGGTGIEVIQVGDTVTVSGSLTNYEGTIEFAYGCTLDGYDTAPMADEPLAEDTAYKFYVAQKNVDVNYYITGEVSGKYLATTLYPSEAADVYAEKAEGGYKFYILVDEVKQYIICGSSAGFATETTCVYKYNENGNYWYTNVDGTNYYLGTYSDYTTLSSSKATYIDYKNTGVSQFPAMFIPASEAKDPTEDEKATYEMSKLSVTEEVTGASEITLNTEVSLYTDVTISWTLKENGGIATLADNVLTITNPTTDQTVTVTANVTCGGTTQTKDFTIAVKAVIGNEPVEETKKYTFSDYTAGTQYADEDHKLDDDITVSTKNGGCHFREELRIYSSNTNNGYAIIASANVISSITLNAGNKVDTLNVYGSANGEDWTLIQGISITATSYNDYTLDINESAGYKYLKLDVAGTSQVRIKYFSITWLKIAESGGTEGGEEKAEYTLTINDYHYLAENKTYTVTLEEGSAVSVADPTAEGYTFKGYQDANGATATLPATLTENVTVTAIWEKNETSEGGEGTTTPSTETVDYKFGTTVGTQYADETIKINDSLTVSTHNKGCHFTSQLRLYDSSSNDGWAIITSMNVISSVTFNMGYKAANLLVYASVDGVTWTLIETVATKTSYADYTVDVDETKGYKYLKIDADGAQIRVASFSITLISASKES